MKVNQQITVNASADKVWQILGADFAKVDRWAARMLDSQGNTDLGPKGGRIVQTVEYGEATETLYRFDDEPRELAYTVEAAGIPPVLSDVTTGWRVEAQGAGQSVVHITFAGKLADPAMSDMLGGRLKEGLDKLLPELKYYVENDEPHPNKQAQLAAQ